MQGVMRAQPSWRNIRSNTHCKTQPRSSSTQQQTEQRKNRKKNGQTKKKENAWRHFHHLVTSLRKKGKNKHVTSLTIFRSGAQLTTYVQQQATTATTTFQQQQQLKASTLFYTFQNFFGINQILWSKIASSNFSRNIYFSREKNQFHLIRICIIFCIIQRIEVLPLWRKKFTS